jgi:hypothetical protein
MFQNILDFIFGRLKPSDFVHDPIMAGAGFAMAGALILALIGLTVENMADDT